MSESYDILRCSVKFPCARSTDDGYRTKLRRKFHAAKCQRAQQVGCQIEVKLVVSNAVV